MKEFLTRKYGGIPVWAIFAVVVLAGGLYLRHRAGAAAAKTGTASDTPSAGDASTLDTSSGDGTATPSAGDVVLNIYPPAENTPTKAPAKKPPAKKPAPKKKPRKRPVHKHPGTHTPPPKKRRPTS